MNLTKQFHYIFLNKITSNQIFLYKFQTAVAEIKRNFSQRTIVQLERNLQPSMINFY